MKFRAVDIPIMAAPSEQKVGLAVQVKRGSTCLLSTLKTFRMSQSLQEVFDGFDLDVAGEVMKAEAADRPSGPWRSIDMQETMDGREKKKKKNPDRPTDPLWKKLWRATKQFFFGLIMKGNDYYNVHRKFQVHSTNIFALGAETRKVATTPSTPNFDSLPYPYPRVG